MSEEIEKDVEREVGVEKYLVVGAMEDLMFRSKVAEAADKLGIEAKFPRSPSKLMDKLRGSVPDLLLLDLNSDRFDAVALLNEVKGDKDLRSIPTLGFLSHVQKDLAVAAKAAGCDRVMARSAFVGGLPDVLKAPARDGRR